MLSLWRYIQTTNVQRPAMPVLRYLGGTIMLLSVAMVQGFTLLPRRPVAVTATQQRRRTTTAPTAQSGGVPCHTVLPQTGMDDFDTLSSTVGGGGIGGFSVVPLLVITALGLGFAAQGWINQQLNGDQGLGAFLQDGRGYQNSSFRPLTDSDRAVNSDNDPLPWLSLPKLDFVEVAGQETTDNMQDDAILTQLEDLRVEMNQQLDKGNVVEASAIRRKLESLMRDNGIEFQADP